MRDGMRHYINPDELAVINRLEVDRDAVTWDDYKVFRALIRRLHDECEEQSSEEMRAIRLRAQQAFDGDDNTNVDDDAEVLKVEAGHWVQGWLWFPKDK